jgi:hypothetical protein
MKNWPLLNNLLYKMLVGKSQSYLNGFDSAKLEIFKDTLEVYEGRGPWNEK